jgi:hypothetical protein
VRTGDVTEVRLTVVTDARGSAIWRACVGGHCVEHASGVRLMIELAALLRSRGVEPPPV